MIVHLFPKSQFSEGFIEFINTEFVNNEHLFVLYTNKPFHIPENVFKLGNVLDYNKMSLCELHKQLKKADKIILHNLSTTFDIMFLLYCSPALCEKSIWLIWGSDLHCYKDERPHILDKFVEHMRKSIISRFRYIATLVRGDYLLVKKWYKTNAKPLRLNYCNLTEIELLTGLRKNSRFASTVRILVGNSSTESNRHEEVLYMLERFKNENLEIIIPLSYGNMEYAKKIEDLAYNLFGSKVTILNKFMSFDEYLKLLSTIDVAIFNNTRQQALGNVYALLYMGTKIYLRPNTELWDGIVNCDGYKVSSVYTLSCCNFEEFSDEKHIEYNQDTAEKYYDIRKRVEEWELAFRI